MGTVSEREGMREIRDGGSGAPWFRSSPPPPLPTPKEFLDPPLGNVRFWLGNWVLKAAKLFFGARQGVIFFFRPMCVYSKCTGWTALQRSRTLSMFKRLAPPLRFSRGLDILLSRNVVGPEVVEQQDRWLTQHLMQGLSHIPRLTILGPCNAHRLPIISFVISVPWDQNRYCMCT